MHFTKRFLKLTAITVLSLLLLAGIILLCAAPIGHYLLEKYASKGLKRTVKTGPVQVNLFSGYVYISDIKIYEQDGDSVFLSAHSLSGYVAVRKLFSKVYDFSGLELDQPVLKAKKWGEKHNYDDLLELFKPKPGPGPHKKAHIAFHSMKIKDGTFRLRDSSGKIDYSLIHIDGKSPGWAWDRDSMLIFYRFQSGTGKGKAGGGLLLDFKSDKYALTGHVNDFDLGIFEQYLHELSNYGQMRAAINASLVASGEFHNKLNIKAKGMVVVNDFHLGKNAQDDYAAFKSLTMSIRDADHERSEYLMDSIVLEKPYFKYERYDHLDNIQMMFGKEGSKVKEVSGSGRFNLIIEIARYTRDLIEKILKSHYAVDHVRVRDGKFRFNDYSTDEKFGIESENLCIAADSIDKNRKRVPIHITTGLNPGGHAALQISVDPNDGNNFDLSYTLNDLPVSIANPYMASYTAYAFTSGTVQANGDWHVNNGRISSNNKLSIKGPALAGITQRNKSTWIPVPLTLLLLEDPTKQTNYSIPVYGSLKHPHFRFGDIVLHALKNTIVKTVVPEPAFDLINSKKKENAFVLNWEEGQYRLSDDQKKFIRVLLKTMDKKEAPPLRFKHVEYTEKEKEFICFFEAKKQYHAEKTGQHRLSEEDSLALEKLSVKDKDFVAFLDRHVKSQSVYTVQEKCRLLTNEATLQRKLEHLASARTRELKKAFEENGALPSALKGTYSKGTPFSGFSCITIIYAGEEPSRLLRIYRNINGANNKWPAESRLRRALTSVFHSKEKDE